MSNAPLHPPSPSPAPGVQEERKKPEAPGIPARVCYQTRESISVTEQANPESRPVSETYSRSVLHLVDATRLADTWRRTIDEYIIGDDEAVARLRGVPLVSREELLKGHAAALERQRVRVTLEEGAYVESDSLNTTPSTPTAASFAPYEPAPVNYPLSVFALCWPSLTPSFPASKPDVGSTWKGVIPVLYGACKFEVRFGMKLLGYEGDDPRMELSLEKQAPSAKVNRVTLVMTPSGSWTMKIDHRDALWSEGKGTFEVEVLARFRTSPEDPQETEVRVLRMKRSFETRRVPATFDAKHVFAAAWRE